MTDTEKKVVKTYRPVEPSVNLFENIPQEQRSYSTTQDKVHGERKFVYYFFIPTTNEEAMARYKCSMKDLIEQGITNKSYSLKFADIIKAMNERGASEQEIADEVQKAMDGMTYEKKAREPKAQVSVLKAKASKADADDAAARELGYANVAELIANVKTRKAKK